MKLFVCDDCGQVDAMALAYPKGPPKPKEWKCTLCQTGEWHGHFEQAEYRPDFDIVVNRPNGLGMETESVNS